MLAYCDDVMDIYIHSSQVHSLIIFVFPPPPQLARYQGDLQAAVGDSTNDARTFYEQAISLDPSQGVQPGVCVCVCDASSNLIIH